MHNEVGTCAEILPYFFLTENCFCCRNSLHSQDEPQQGYFTAYYSTLGARKAV